MRLIARCRYADAMLDLSANGVGSAIPWGGAAPGMTSDTDSLYGPRVGSSVTSTEYFNGSLSVLVLSRTAPDTAALDAALQGAMA